MLSSAVHRVAAYFDGKTAGILERYGPGPRVHYHTGLVDDPPAIGATVAALRQELVRGQELMLQEAAAAWDASQSLSGEILDIGCGLGGGSIFWAQEFGAQVTALTCVPSHAEHVARFATQAGVAPTSRGARLRCFRSPWQRSLRRGRRSRRLRLSSAPRLA